MPEHVRHLTRFCFGVHRVVRPLGLLNITRYSLPIESTLPKNFLIPKSCAMIDLQQNQSTLQNFPIIFRMLDLSSCHRQGFVQALDTRRLGRHIKLFWYSVQKHIDTRIRAQIFNSPLLLYLTIGSKDPFNLHEQQRISWPPR